MSGNKKYYDRKEAGLCTRCGKAEAREGKTQCAACAELKRQRDTVLKAKMQSNRAAGLCACGAVPEPGRKQCHACRIMGRNNMRKYMAKRKELFKDAIHLQ